jgi:sugar-phosphatase
LINSQQAVVRSWQKVAEEADIAFEKLAGLHGIPSKQALRMIIGERGEQEVDRWAGRIDELELSDGEGVEIVSGARELLQELSANSIPWLIVTSCSRQLAEFRTSQVGIEIPAGSVTFDDVDRGKPFPDPYLLGRSRVAEQRRFLTNLEIWAVEDAPAGISSAKAADCKVAAVQTTHQAPSLGEADLILSHLRDLRSLIEPQS